ncbi:hypothetical protein B0I71DRAFT_129730 [Yarrowia lipolytica]|uniref:Uncharacterized protein n=1 Tax=Yarrowia lipolytica TaxID=4952 RepID=A0A371CA27_YARLL|nr:hypothetical protein B0I71DRAFT_129730 [Yarrowia lipolytica]
MDTPTRPRADLGSINLLKGSIRNSIRKNADKSANKENRPVDVDTKSHEHKQYEHKQYEISSPRADIQTVKTSVDVNSPSVMATFDSNGQRIFQYGRPASPTKQLRKSRSNASISGPAAADSSFSMPSPQIAHLSPKFKRENDSWSTPRIQANNRTKRPPSTPLTPGQFQQNVRRVKLGTPATVSTCNLFYPPSHGLADDGDDEDDKEDSENHTAPFPTIPAFSIDTPVICKPLPSFNPNWDSPDCHLSDSTPMGTPDTVLKMRQYITKLKSKPRFVSLADEDAANASLSQSQDTSQDSSFGPVSPVKSRKQPLIDLADLESQLVTQRYDLEIEQMTDVLDFMKLEAKLKV